MQNIDLQRVHEESKASKVSMFISPLYSVPSVSFIAIECSFLLPTYLPVIYCGMRFRKKLIDDVECQ